MATLFDGSHLGRMVHDMNELGFDEKLDTRATTNLDLLW